jgi:hypothetical protein
MSQLILDDQLDVNTSARHESSTGSSQPTTSSGLIGRPGDKKTVNVSRTSEPRNRKRLIGFSERVKELETLHAPLPIRVQHEVRFA